MTRLIALALAAALLGACAAQGPRPMPDGPECRTPDKAPVDGGMGGTGRKPPCKTGK